MIQLIYFPEELLYIIKSYIPIYFLSTTNKNMWLKNYYHNSLLNQTKLNNNILYYKFIIQNDFEYIFYNYIHLNKKIFIKKHKYKYKKKIFPRKLEIFNYLINFEYQSLKCKDILCDFMKTNKLTFKKIKTNNNKWRN
jgi:hypothetical protein